MSEAVEAEVTEDLPSEELPEFDGVRTEGITVVTDATAVMIPNGDESLVSKEEAEKTRDEIRLLIDSLSTSYWALAEKLGQVQKMKMYRVWGFSSVQDWVTAEFAFARRKAYYLVQINEYFNKRLAESLPPEQHVECVATAKEIGWSKASVLATENVITPQNCQKVLDAAKSMSVDALTDKCREIKKQLKDEGLKDDLITDTPVQKLCSKSFKMSEWQKEVIENCLDKARQTMGDENVKDGHVLAYICSDFEANSGVNLADTFSKFERLFGVDIVAVSQSHGKIVFGEDTLKALAEVTVKNMEASSLSSETPILQQ
jgi:hypothetical protein